MKIKAETGVMQTQAQECWQPPEAERGKKVSFPWRVHCLDFRRKASSTAGKSMVQFEASHLK